MNAILTLNTRTGETRTTACSPQERGWGGRSFIVHDLLAHVDPGCDPLGRGNRFILASGLLADTAVTTAGRLSVGGKSPLTGGVKEANVGGAAGRAMARLGLKAVILEDAPDDTRCRILFIGKDRAELLDAPELAGKPTRDTLSMLRERFGGQIGALCIGPAGEMRLTAAMVATTDDTGVQLRVAGRGGLGAVMGSKGIKAIVFDDTGARPEEPSDRKALSAAARDLAGILKADPKTDNRHNLGTPAVLMLCNALGILPTRNFREGRFEHAEAISGEMIADLIDKRGGEARRGLPCVQGCIIACSNVFADPSGKTTVASLQYENIGLLGSNCGIGDVDAVAELNDLCNQVGIDTIDGGAAIGVAMEAGLLAFGDAEGAKDLLRQVGAGTPLGRIIGSGVAVDGPGARRAPDPRHQGPGDSRVRSPVAQGHRGDLRNGGDGRRPHRRQCPGDGEDGRPAGPHRAGGDLAAAADPWGHPGQPRRVPLHPSGLRQGARSSRRGSSTRATGGAGHSPTCGPWRWSACAPSRSSTRRPGSRTRCATCRSSCAASPCRRTTPYSTSIATRCGTSGS